MNMKEYAFNPFPGLRPFEEDEEHLFFGREKSVAQLLSRLRTSRFLAVIGTSGSGKSSLVKSGLLPSLYRGFMAGAGSGWRVALFRPGDNPVGNLANALAEPGILTDDRDMDHDEGSGGDIRGKFIETTLRRSNRGLVEVVKQASLREHDNLLLVVDQFEELFRFSRLERDKRDGKRDSVSFVRLLLESAAQSDVPVYIIITMRSDFLGDCTTFRGLPEAINDGQYLIPRMTRDERRAAIEGPVAVGGAEISPMLISRLLNDVGDDPDHLPVLQHALMRTWDYWAANRRPGEPLDLRHYQDIGTMDSALSRHAEEAFGQLKHPGSQEICEKLFKLLTQGSKSGSGVRRPAKISEICRVTHASEDEVIKVIDLFRQPGRTFLMPPQDVPLEPDTVVDISHESFMRVWNRLKGWVKEEEQSAEFYIRLATAAALHEEGETGLWRDPELMLGLKWREENRPDHAWAQRYDPSFAGAIRFLKASKEQQDFEVLEKERQQKAKVKRARILVLVISIAAVVSLCFAAWAMVMEKEAHKQRNEAVRLRELAEARTREAEEAKRKAVLEKIKAIEAGKEADRSAEEAKKARLEADKNARAAQRNFQRAEVQKKKAVENELEAKIQGLIADMNKAEARCRQLLAKSKELAVQSMAHNGKTRDEKALKAALAMIAYRMHYRAYSDLEKAVNENYNAYRRLAAGNKNKIDNPRLDREVNEKYEQLRKKAGVHSTPPVLFSALRIAYIANSAAEDDICPAESWVLAAVGEDGIVYNTEQGELEKITLKTEGLKLPVKGGRIRLTAARTVSAASMVDSGDQLFCGTGDGRIYSWRKGEWQEKILPGNHGAKILSVVFSKQRNRLFYSVKNVIYRHDLENTPGVLRTFEPNNYIRALTLIENAGSSLLIAAASSGNIYQYCLKTKKWHEKYLAGDLNPAGFYSSAYNPASKLLALGGINGEIFLFDNVDCETLAKGKEISAYPLGLVHKGIVRTLAFSRDGRYFASGGLDGMVMMWDLNGNRNRVADIAHLPPSLIIENQSKILSLVFALKDRYLIFGDEQRLNVCPTGPKVFYDNLHGKVKRVLADNEWERYIGDSIQPGDIE